MKLARVQYTAFTADEWRRYAVCEVSKPVTKTSSFDETPYDERMGTLVKGAKCLTCDQTHMDCPGHFGYIELPEPMYNVKYLPFLKLVLRCVCYACGASKVLNGNLIMEKKHNTSGKSRLDACAAIAKKLPVCMQCHKPHPNVDIENSHIEIYTTKKDRIPLTAREVLTCLRKIQPETLELIGLDKIDPEAFLFRVFPVIPPTSRPWVVKEDDRCNDDLTEEYNAIVKTCDNLRKLSGASEVKRSKLLEELQGHINSIIDNKSEVSKQSSGGRTRRSLQDRIQGKGGRINNNVTGKRTDFSARTVIGGGGPLLDADQVGIPEKIATTLTKPEKVTQITYDYLQHLVNTGKANVVIRNGSQIRLDHATKNYTKEFTLVHGDTVERHLRDDDYVIINRQPTLRIESMQGFRVKLTKGEKIIRVPLSSTAPFNADFDGDEMNTHLPQSVTATAETKHLMSNHNHYITAQTNSPVSGITQDGLIAVYLITKFNPDIPIGIFYDCCIAAGIESDITNLFKRAKPYYGEINTTIPGKLAMSIVFPEDFTYVRKGKELFTLARGIILPSSSPLTKKTMGSSKDSIIHRIAVEYSTRHAVRLVTKVQKFTDRWLPTFGFSIGIEDCLPSEGDIVEETLRMMTLKASMILSEPQYDEIKLNAELNSAMANALIIADTSINKGESNALNVMRMAGAKGSVVNCAQICAFLGQQNIDGKRPPKMLHKGGRRLPYFLPGDESPEAGGFISSSFITGLSPTECFFHAVSGRRGIIDTAVKTSDSGYIQKQIGRKLEDLVSQIDMTVRDAFGRIVQFIYGGDGLSADHLYYVHDTKWKPNYPFFIDPGSLASKLCARFPGEKPRLMTKQEIDLLMQFLIYHTAEELKVKPDPLRQALLNIKNTLRKMLKSIKLPPSGIPHLFREIRDQFIKAQVPYGEMVGLMATDFISEPVTQSTLNSVPYDTKILLLSHNEKIIIEEIGAFVDRELDNIPVSKRVRNESNGGTEWIPLPVGRFKIQSCNESGLSMWCDVTGVSKHRPCGDLVEITLDSGRRVIGTQSKSFLVLRQGKMKPTEGFRIREGDLMPVLDDLGIPPDFMPKGQIDRETANVLGVIMDNYRFDYLNSRKKNIYPKVIYETGKITEWFSHNRIQCPDVSNPYIVRKYARMRKTMLCMSKRLNHRDTLLKLLNSEYGAIYMFVTSYISVASSYRSGYRIFCVKSEEIALLWCELGIRLGVHLSIARRNNGKWEISLQNNIMKTKLFNICEKNFRPSHSTIWKEFHGTIVSEVVSVRYIPEEEHPLVYDLTVDNTMNFAVLGGLVVRDTFHHTGHSAKDVTLGVPRIRELFNCTKSDNQKTPSTSFYFEDGEQKYATPVEYQADMLDRIQSLRLTYTIMRDLITKVKMYKTRPDVSISPIAALAGKDLEEYTVPWWSHTESIIGDIVVSIRFSHKKLYQRRCSLDELVEIIQNSGPFIAYRSPLALGTIDIMIDEVPEFPDKTSGAVTPDNMMYFYVRDVVIPYIKDLYVCGTKNIDKVFPAKNEKRQLTIGDEDIPEMFIETQGTNLSELLTIPGVDVVRTKSDDMWEMLECFGIEGARAFLIEELTRVICFDGAYINPRHIELLVDSMTVSGTLTSVRRDGINRKYAGPVAKIVFERPIDNAVRASVFGEADNLSGISSCVAFGKVGRSGTGAVEVALGDDW